MKPAKEQVVDILNKLPDDCTMQEVIYHLYVRGRIERGMKALAEGQTLTHEEVEKRLQEKFSQ